MTPVSVHVEINKISHVSPYHNITPLLDVKSPQLHLVPVVTLPQLGVSLIPSITPVLILISCHALVPGYKAVGPTGPAPSAVLVLRALQLSVPWVTPAALRAMRWSPFWTIEEGDSVQQCKLTNLLNLLLSICYLFPGILEDIPQGLLDIGFASVLIYLSNHPWVPQIHYHLIDYELLRAAPPELLPHCGVHATVVVGPSSNVDRDGLFQVCFVSRTVSRTLTTQL